MRPYPGKLKHSAPGGLDAPAGRVPASEALVEARDIGRIYGSGATAVTALSSASFTVRAGDQIALLGPSGSGKSTLLHLLGGLDTPSYGSLSWPALGSRATLRPGKVAFVFQAPSLLPPLSVLDNVALPLLLNHVPEPTARDAAHESLDRLGILDIAAKLPEELSGGQAQRVGIARALACRPQLILADEPTGQLDRATADQVIEVLIGSLDAGGSALLIATHDLALAERLQQRWRLNHGVLEGASPC